MVAPEAPQQLYLSDKITLPSPTTPETTIEGRFTPGPFVFRAQVCTGGTIESQHPNLKRANIGLHEAYIAHRQWHQHQRQEQLCVPEFPIPLLQIFTDHSTNESIIRPVKITSGPKEELQTTVFELPEEADTLPYLYAVELPETMPRKSFWDQARKFFKI